MSEPRLVRTLVDDLFRRSAGRLVSTLTRLLGPASLHLAEEAVQEAMLRALEVWRYEGVPPNPTGWLTLVAKRRAIDLARRERLYSEKLERLERSIAGRRTDSSDPGRAVVDDELCMIFMCCHPAIPPESRIALTLKTVGGFSVREIARALLAREPAVAQRLVRAKRRLREREVAFELPPDAELRHRLGSVLEVLYLMFNEGYGATAGQDLVRADLCREAIRLTRLLVRAPRIVRPAVHAVLALMLLQASRLPARQRGDGSLALLWEQDPSRWDSAARSEGMRELALAGRGTELTAYHLEAGIAACHAVANGKEPDWSRILEYYDALLQVRDTPVVRLNRAVAVGMVHGPDAAIDEIQALEADPALRDYYLLPATAGEFHRRAGRREEAGRCFAEALEIECTEPERRFLRRRLAELQGRAPSDAQIDGPPPH